MSETIALVGSARNKNTEDKSRENAPTFRNY